MKSFSTSKGDVVVDKDIVMVSDDELLRQKVERVLGTNQGEWEFDEEEGIDFQTILQKNPSEDEISGMIQEALTRIDETIVISEFSMKVDGRSARIEFLAVNGNGVEVGGEYSYGG